MLPSFFKIWGYGKTTTDYGDQWLSRVLANKLVNDFIISGRRVNIDYNHGTVADVVTPESGRAAGFGDLEAREDGLYLVNIEWTTAAKTYLADGEYRYFSPVYQLDNIGRVIGFLNIALTNIPATHNLEAIMPGPVEDENADIEKTAISPESQAEEAGLIEKLEAVIRSIKLDDMTPVQTALDLIEQLKAGEAEELATTVEKNLETRDPEVVAGKIMALKAAVKQLQARPNQKQSVADIVAAGIKAGKIAPGQRETFLKMSAKTLQGYLSAAPVIFAAAVEDTTEIAAAAKKIDSKPTFSHWFGKYGSDK